MGLVYRVICRGRDWWLDTWMTWALIVYYFGICAVGAVGYRDPSVSMTRLVGAASGIYATGALVLGCMAILAAGQGQVGRRAEGVCLRGIGVLTVLHGVIVIYGSEGSNGLQTGIRLVASLPGAFVLAHYRANTVYTRRDIRKALSLAEHTAQLDRAREEAAGRVQ